MNKEERRKKNKDGENKGRGGGKIQNSKFKIPPIKVSGGFTLLEMLVSISIFTIVTTIAIFSNNQFNSSVLLTNLTYEIALSVREAQSYGVLIKAPSTSDYFNSGYGIRFVRGDSEYFLFEDKAADVNLADSLPDGKYNSSDDAILHTYKLRGGNKISQICLTESSASPRPDVDITFLRPNPDARIRNGNDNFNKAEICVTAPDGSDRKIIVSMNGQISVDAINTAECNPSC